MTQRFDPPPHPEELAAYFDGELRGANRQRLEAWLADHPSAQADLEEWRHLAGLAHSTRPADPGEPVWRGVLARIETATPAPRHAWPLLRVTAALAACLALAFYLAPSDGPPPVADELVVASASDVEIISMDAGDVSALVVGRPPLHEPLVLAESADIHIESIEPDHDGSMPAVRWWVDDEAPMIVAVAER
jgi:anti-sigma factor RsiW